MYVCPCCVDPFLSMAWICVLFCCYCSLIGVLGPLECVKTLGVYSRGRKWLVEWALSVSPNKASGCVHENVYVCSKCVSCPPSLIMVPAHQFGEKYGPLLQVYRVDPLKNQVFVLGAVPGATDSWVLIKDAIKKPASSPLPFPSFMPREETCVVVVICFQNLCCIAYRCESLCVLWLCWRGIDSLFLSCHVVQNRAERERLGGSRAADRSLLLIAQSTLFPSTKEQGRVAPFLFGTGQ